VGHAHPTRLATRLAILVFMNDYETAKAGGPHHGFWKEKSKLPNHLIEKSIRSIEKQIALHESWIAKPYSKLSPDIDARQVADLVNEKWPQDIQRQREQVQILRGILNERKTRTP